MFFFQDFQTSIPNSRSEEKSCPLVLICKARDNKPYCVEVLLLLLLLLLLLFLKVLFTDFKVLFDCFQLNGQTQGFCLQTSSESLVLSEHQLHVMMFKHSCMSLKMCLYISSHSFHQSYSSVNILVLL